MKRQERGSGLFVLPCSVRTQVTVCEAQSKPLKNPESAGAFIFKAGLPSLWHWNFCCCKLCSLRVLSPPPPVCPVPSPHSLSLLFLLSFLCIGYQVSTTIFCQSSPSGRRYSPDSASFRRTFSDDLGRKEFSRGS